MNEPKDSNTDPYGKLDYCIGNDEDFICFDYEIRPDGRVTIHSSVNSESGHFLDKFQKKTVSKFHARREALGQIDDAWDWCGDLEDINREESEKSAKKFVEDLMNDIRERRHQGG